MNHKEQVREFEIKLDELINWFCKEFTDITYASLVGVLTFKIHQIINQAINEK